MRNRRVTILAVLALAIGFFGFAGFHNIRAEEGTEVYMRLNFVIPRYIKSSDVAAMKRETMFRAQYRVARANMTGVDVTINEDGELDIKARRVVDVEGFKVFLSRPGEWQIQDEQGTILITRKQVTKTLVDTSGSQPSVCLMLSKPMAGMVESANGPIQVVLVMDGEKATLDLKLANNGKAILLSGPEFTETKAWLLRSLLSLPAYPCELKIIDFRSGDDLLHNLFG